MTNLIAAGNFFRAVLLSAVALMFVGGLPVSAQNALPKSSALAGDPEGWRVKVGGFALVVPEYIGSDEYEFVGGPSLDIKYSNWFFANPIDGIGVNIINRNGLKIGGAVGYRAGRDDDDGALLAGLAEIEDGAEAIAFAKYRLGPVQFSTSYKYGVGEDDTGALYTFGIGSGLPIRDGFIILGQISAEFMDSDYADAYFSVSGSTAGLADYDAASGWRSASASLIGIVDLSDKWSLQAIGRYTYLGDHAADSPIVESRDQWFGGIGLTYKIYESGPGARSWK